MNLDPAPEVENFDAAPPVWNLAGEGSTDLVKKFKFMQALYGYRWVTWRVLGKDLIK